MWIARGLISETGIAERAVHSGVARLAESIIAAGGVALEVVLPDGSRIGFGLPARIKLFIRDHAMLAQLADATLSSLAEAYVHGPHRRARRFSRSGAAGRADRRCRRLEYRAAGSAHAVQALGGARTAPPSGITTTSATSSIACGSTSAWCIRAPISRAAMNRSTKRSAPSSITSAASCGLRAGRAPARCRLRLGRVDSARGSRLWRARCRHHTVAKPV